MINGAVVFVVLTWASAFDEQVPFKRAWPLILALSLFATNF